MMTNNFLPPGAVPFTNAYTVDVTQKLAQSWLDNDEVVRPVSEPRVQILATKMEFGLWRSNHSCITFAKDGTLLDGVHRLRAIIRSGKTVPLIIVINEPLENADVIDNRNNG